MPFALLLFGLGEPSREGLRSDHPVVRLAVVFLRHGTIEFSGENGTSSSMPFSAGVSTKLTCLDGC